MVPTDFNFEIGMALHKVGRDSINSLGSYF